MNNNLSIKRGNSLFINYTNQDNSSPPLPISLSGATLYFTVKSVPWDTNASDSSAIFQVLSSGNTGNTCTFSISPAQTELLSPGTNYYYDITISYANGVVVTPIYGDIKVNPTVTNKAS